MKKPEITINLGPRIGSMTLLTVLFFCAKILGYISWSWVWVFAPLWIPTAVGLVFLGLGLSFLALVFILDLIRTMK
jgi:hypothetical protein